MAEISLYLMVLAAQYLACVLFYHAEPKRSRLAVITNAYDQQPLRVLMVKVSGWLVLLSSLGVSLVKLGAERGISVALGIVGIAGFASLFVSCYAPQRHVLSGVIAIAIASLGGMTQAILS